MDQQTTQAIQRSLEKNMQKVRDSGLLAGSKAICAVIFQKATDQTKSHKERIDDIVEFCAKSLSMFEKKDSEQ